MPLKAKSAKDLVSFSRAKILVSGESSTGKSSLGLQFPNSYIFDTEDGVSFYKDAIEKSGSAVLKTLDPEEVVKEIRTLMTEKSNYRTVIIDPITNLWYEQLDESAKTKGEAYGRHYGDAGKQMRRMAYLLIKLDMNVIFTAHSKDVWEGKGDSRTKSDTTYDGWGKSEYFFDLWLKLSKREKIVEGYRGAEFWAKVEKTRLNGFPLFDEFKIGELNSAGYKNNMAYKVIAERFGWEQIERAATPSKLATMEQIVEAKTLIEKVHPSPEWLQKAFKFAGAEDLEDFSEELVIRFIDKLKEMQKI